MKLDIEKLKILQAQNCLENKELAQMSKVSLLTLQRIKNGSTKPRLATIGRIAKSLKVDVVELLV